MQPKLWEGEVKPEGVKPVMLRMGIDGKGRPALNVVNENGDAVASVALFFHDAIRPLRGAKDMLEEGEYDTSWAQWNDDGAIVLDYNRSLI